MCIRDRCKGGDVLSRAALIARALPEPHLAARGTERSRAVRARAVYYTHLKRPPTEQAEPLTAHHRKESDRLRLDVFFVAGARVRTRIYLDIRTLGEQNPPFTDGKQRADAFGVK